MGRPDAAEGGATIETHVIAGAGHAPQEEAPEEVNELLLRFLGEDGSR